MSSRDLYDIALELKSIRQILEGKHHKPTRCGKWERDSIVLTTNPAQYMFTCSNCRYQFVDFEVKYNYCPSCGFFMGNFTGGAE